MCFHFRALCPDRYKLHRCACRLQAAASGAVASATDSSVQPNGAQISFSVTTATGNQQVCATKCAPFYPELMLHLLADHRASRHRPRQQNKERVIGVRACDLQVWQGVLPAAALQYSLCHCRVCNVADTGASSDDSEIWLSVCAEAVGLVCKRQDVCRR